MSDGGFVVKSRQTEKLYVPSGTLLTSRRKGTVWPSVYSSTTAPVVKADVEGFHCSNLTLLGSMSAAPAGEPKAMVTAPARRPRDVSRLPTRSHGRGRREGDTHTPLGSRGRAPVRAAGPQRAHRAPTSRQEEGSNQAGGVPPPPARERQKCADPPFTAGTGDPDRRRRAPLR